MTQERSPNIPNVLLVQELADDRHMYAEYLRLSQFTAVETENTADALILALTADAIVVDICLPGPFDGLELIRRLRADERTRLKPILVVTACAFESDQQRAIKAGCDVFLPKPCLPERLVAEIRRLLPARSPRSRPARAEPARKKKQDIA